MLKAILDLETSQKFFMRSPLHFFSLQNTVVFFLQVRKAILTEHILVLRVGISNIFSLACNTDLFSLDMCVSLILLNVQLRRLHAKLLLLGH